MPFTKYVAMALTEDAFKLVVALTNPEKTKGISLVAGLDECTEGTFLYRKIRKVAAPVGIQSAMDRTAAVGLAVADALWAAVADAAYETELLAEKKAAEKKAAAERRAAEKRAAAAAAAATAARENAARSASARAAKATAEAIAREVPSSAGWMMAMIEKMRSGNGKIPTPPLLMKPPRLRTPAEDVLAKVMAYELDKKRAAWKPGFPGERYSG